MSTRFGVVLLVFPLGLSGCGLATRVQGALSMPAPPMQPVQVGKGQGQQAPQFDSLARSLGGLNRTTLDAAIARWQSPSPKSLAPRARPAFLPLAGQIHPALSLARAQNSAPSPLLLRGNGDDFSFSSVPLAVPHIGTPNGAPLRVVAARTIGASSASGASPTGADVQAFLSGWAARQSLARADEEFLGRRALNERIALQGRSALAELDLSLVPPDVQLELTNLRLQLLPLLAVPRGQRARAQARIDAIEARLRAIWQAETARQARLWRQSLEEVPARLSREGEAALQAQTLRQARLDREQRVHTRNEALAHLRPRALPPLSLRQSAALAPDVKGARALLQTPFAPLPNPAHFAPPPLAPDQAPLSVRGADALAGSSKRLAALAAREQRVWKAAVR